MKDTRVRFPTPVLMCYYLTCRNKETLERVTPPFPAPVNKLYKGVVMEVVMLKTDKGKFCFESPTDAHAFEDRLNIFPTWHTIGYEDTKWANGVWLTGYWREAVEEYNSISHLEY